MTAVPKDCIAKAACARCDRVIVVSGYDASRVLAALHDELDEARWGQDRQGRRVCSYCATNEETVRR